MRSLLAFVLLAVAIDRVGGEALDALQRRPFAGGGHGLVNHQLATGAEVLVLGSSRARHHIDPAVLRDELSLTAFNAGVAGHDLLYAVMLFDLWRRAHPAPRAIVLNVDPGSFSRSEDELQKASVFGPFAGESERVREVLDLRGAFEPVKRLSRLYRYNGNVLPILKAALVPIDPAFDGFVPATGRFDPAAPGALPTHEASMRRAEAPFWAVKLRYLGDLAAWCRAHGTRLFLVHGPAYAEDRMAHALWAARVEELTASLPGVAFVDLGEAAGGAMFAERPELYRDDYHLNARGARIFSALLARTLRERLGPAVVAAAGEASAATALTAARGARRAATVASVPRPAAAVPAPSSAIFAR
jgi:hypothetical protein